MMSSSPQYLVVFLVEIDNLHKTFVTIHGVVDFVPTADTITKKQSNVSTQSRIMLWLDSSGIHNMNNNYSRNNTKQTDRQIDRQADTSNQTKQQYNNTTEQLKQQT